MKNNLPLCKRAGCKQTTGNKSGVCSRCLNRERNENRLAALWVRRGLVADVKRKQA